IIRAINLVPGNNVAVNAVFFGAATGSSSAQFLGTDTTTQGNWRSAYGADGYDIAQDTSAANPVIPAYAQVSLSGESNWTWPSSYTAIYPLQNAASNGTIAACWFAPSSFDIHIDLTDGRTHQVALYATDPDGSVEFQVLDAASETVLDTETPATSFGS